MQFSEVSAIREFTLSAQIVESLSGARVDCQTQVSWGGLLEWLIAIRRAQFRSIEQVAADCPIRLCRVMWHAQFAPEPGASLSCRVHAGFALVCVGAQDRQLLLSASATEAEPLPVFARTSLPSGQRQPADAFYAELAKHGLEVETRARAVEYACFTSNSAGAVLRHDLAELEAGFILGPRALDAALHVALAYALRARRPGSETHQPFSTWLAIDRVVVHAASGSPRTIVVSDRTTDPALSARVDVSLLDPEGSELARLEGVSFRDRVTVNRQLRAVLVGVFEQVARACLPSTRIDPHTALPALGASSLDLVRIGSHVHEWLGWTPPLAAFLATPTLAGLVDLYLRREAQPKPTDTPIASSDVLSATERQLWFLESVTNAAGAYNEGFAWRILGALSIDTLERALARVQRRHPALRSYFPAHDGVPQRRLDWRQCDLELIEMPAAVQSSAELTARYVEHQVGRAFDLEHAPPFRCALILRTAGDAILVVSAHHIVCDAWSFARVLVPELSAAYAALLEAPDSPPPLPAAMDARRELERRELDPAYRRAAEQHFRSRLGALPHLLDFPFDHPRPAVQTHRGTCSHRPLTAARWRAVKALACELEHSPFVVCLAAYQILLQRYARMDTFCIGVPVSLRRDAEDARAFGCLVNLSVIRSRVDLAQDFRALCASVRTELIETLAFDQLAFGDIVGAVTPARTLSFTPVVQAVFGYRELAGAALDLPDTTTSPLFVHNQRAKFDLTLSIDDFGDDAELSLEYATDLLEGESAVRVLDHFEALLDELLRKPNSRIGALRLSGRRERQQIAGYEHGPKRAVPLYALGLALLQHRSENARVLRTSDRVWSAGELRQATSRIAAALRASGVRPGEFVAVCAARSAEWVAAVLAILDVGAAYVPLDPAWPIARIRSTLARANARVVIALDHAFVRGSDSELTVLELRELPAALPAELAAGRLEVALAGGPVYGITTSGSEGTPRIAAVSHAAFSNLLAFYADLVSLTAADRVLVATSVGFDLTQKNLFAALIAGAELVIDDADSFDPERLTDLIELHAVSVLNCTPSLAYALVAVAAARDLNKLRSLRVLVLGGEPIDWHLLSAWTEHPSCSARIVNSYGPTECTDVVTAWVAHDSGAHDLGRNLGTPIQNARCRVVDVAGTIAGIGVPGELWLAGAPLGLGYLGDPTATAKKFVRDRSTRWYRTGDLVRWNGEGELEYLGRLDAQVKIRGSRIELAEIEAALQLQPEVADAVVIGRPDLRGQPALIGYVVLRPAAGSGETGGDLGRTLQSRLAQTLPSYMIPPVIVAIERVPRTASGKLDRSALQALPWPTPAAAVSSSDRDFELALHPLRARVSAAFCRVLGVSAIAGDANFFEHGGHSLAAVQLVAQLEVELGIRLRVASLFERPVVRDYAAFLAEELARIPGSDSHVASTSGSALRAG